MKQLFVVVITFFILTSCQKENSTELQPNYLPLKIGNYWIYQYFVIDYLGNETELAKIDSVVIIGDTIINNNRYFIFEGDNHTVPVRNIVDILRDSSGYIVDNHGKIQFSNNNFTDTLNFRFGTCCENDTIFIISYTMERPNYNVSVPAGTFNVLNYKGTFYSPIDLVPLGFENPFYFNTYYADKIGKISQNQIYSERVLHDKRLIRYHIQE